jgi:hypothetical protein
MLCLKKCLGSQDRTSYELYNSWKKKFNQAIRIAFARNITRFVKEHEGITSEHQYGRAHKTCMTPVLNKMLIIQLLIQKNVEVIVFDNDAKGCYDRIISGVALACLKHIGHSNNSVRMIGLLGAQLEHHIATGYKVSDKTYSSTLKKILYGIGQGGCASPILWELLNQLLLTALGEKFDCIRMVSVDGEKETVRPGDSLVDDTTTAVTNDDTTMDPVPVEKTDMMQSEDDLIGQLQNIIQFCLDLLQVTGGELDPEKCEWFLIYQRWKSGKRASWRCETPIGE